MLKTQTSSGACLSASCRKADDLLLLARIERARRTPSARRFDLADQRRQLLAFRRPAKTVKPSAANFLAISPPMKSPAPTTAAVAFRFSMIVSRTDRSGLSDIKFYFRLVNRDRGKKQRHVGEWSADKDWTFLESHLHRLGGQPIDYGIE